MFDGLDDSGWLYVPAGCEAAGAACRLHVVFHGCAQGQRAAGPGGKPIARQFVSGAGYNRWAEANRIVVLYPQVLASQALRSGDSYRLNPEGCWDFWGYTDPDGALAGSQARYARRSAPQLRAVKAMVDALLRPAP
jgi:poly(3-hydroxybutyrate) depolymerase